MAPIESLNAWQRASVSLMWWCQTFAVLDPYGLLLFASCVVCSCCRPVLGVLPSCVASHVAVLTFSEISTPRERQAERQEEITWGGGVHDNKGHM